MNSFIRDGVCTRNKRSSRLSKRRKVTAKTRVSNRISILLSDDDDGDKDAAGTSAIITRSKRTPALNSDDDINPGDLDRSQIDQANNAVDDNSSSYRPEYICYDFRVGIPNLNEDLQNYLKEKDEDKQKNFLESIFEKCLLVANDNVDECTSMMNQLEAKHVVPIKMIDLKGKKFTRVSGKLETRSKLNQADKLNSRLVKRYLEVFGSDFSMSDDESQLENEKSLRKLSTSSIHDNDISLKISEVFSLTPNNVTIEKNLNPEDGSIDLNSLVSSSKSQSVDKQENLTTVEMESKSDIQDFEKLTPVISEVLSLNPINDQVERNLIPDDAIIEQPIHDFVEKDKITASTNVEIHLNSISESHSLCEKKNQTCNENKLDSEKLPPVNDKIEVLNSPSCTNLVVNVQDENVIKSATDKTDNENSNDLGTLKNKIRNILNLNDKAFSDSILTDLAKYFGSREYLSKFDREWGSHLWHLTIDLIKMLFKKHNDEKFNMALLSGCLVCVFRMIIEENSPSCEIKIKLNNFINAIRKYAKHLDRSMWRSWFINNLFSDWFIMLVEIFMPNKISITDEKSFVDNVKEYLKKVEYCKYIFNCPEEIVSEKTSVNEETEVKNKNDTTIDTRVELKVPPLKLNIQQIVHSTEAKSKLNYVPVLEPNTISSSEKPKKRKYEKKNRSTEKIKKKEIIKTINDVIENALTSDYQNNKRQIEANVTKNKKLKVNHDYKDGNNPKHESVIENNVQLFERSLAEHSAGSNNQIEYENVNHISSNVGQINKLKINVRPEYTRLLPDQNIQHLGLFKNIPPEYFHSGNDRSIPKNNDNESLSVTLGDEINQTIETNLKQNMRVSPLNAFYQIPDNPHKFSISSDHIVPKNLSPYYNNISASNLNSSNTPRIPVNICSAQLSKNKNSRPSTAINTRSFNTTNIRPLVDKNTQSSSTMNTQPSCATYTQCSSTMNIQSYMSGNIQPSAINTQPLMDINTRSSTAIDSRSFGATNTHPFMDMNTRPSTAINTRSFDTTNIRPSVDMNTQSSSTMNTQSSCATNTQYSNTMNIQSYMTGNIQPSAINTQASTNSTHPLSTIIRPSTALNTYPSTAINARPSSSINTQSCNNSKLLKYLKNPSFSAADYNCTQLPLNNKTNVNGYLSTPNCNEYYNESYNSFVYNNSKNLSSNYKSNQNFATPSSGNSTIYPQPISNYASSNSSVTNTVTFGQDIRNYSYNSQNYYHSNQMSNTSYHPSIVTASGKSGLPPDNNDKVSPDLPDKLLQNTPNQANTVTLYGQY